jgi:hypothetical protein
VKIRPVGAKLSHADGQSDMTTLTFAFRNVANAPKTLKNYPVENKILNRLNVAYNSRKGNSTAVQHTVCDWGSQNRSNDKKSSGIWRCVDWYTDKNVSEELAAAVWLPRATVKIEAARCSETLPLHSFCSLSYDRSVASSKASSPQGAI